MQSNSTNPRGLVCKVLALLSFLFFTNHPQDLLAQAGPGPTPFFEIIGVDPSDQVGRSVTCLPNFVGSGINSVAIGNPGAVNGGNVRIYEASGGHALQAEFAGGGARAAGVSIAAIGDVGLGNRLPELLVGMPSESPSAFPSQSVVYAGPDGMINFTPVNSVGTFTNLGIRVAGLYQDSNTNDAAEFFTSTTDFSSGGAVFLNDVVATGALQSYSASTTGEMFGSAITSIQDMDSDGVRDVLISAPFFSGSGGPTGQVRLFDTVSGNLIYNLDGDTNQDVFGSSLAVVGDVDGNGFDDFLVGAPSLAGALPGYARLFGSRPPNLPSVLCTLNGIENGDDMGFAVAGLGDIDGDGNLEFAVGAPGVGLDDDGRVFIYRYNQTTAVCDLVYTLNPTQPGLRFGEALAGFSAPGVPCDLNSDGIADLAVSSGFSPGRVNFFIGAAIPTPTPTATPTSTPTNTPTPSLTPPSLAPSRANFTFKISTTGNLVATNRLNRVPPNTCTTTLYGRTSTADLREIGPVFMLVRAAKQNSKVLRFQASQLRRSVCDVDGKPFSAHLMTEVHCGDNRFFSNVFARQMSCGLKPAVARAKWPRQLARKIR